MVGLMLIWMCLGYDGGWGFEGALDWRDRRGLVRSGGFVCRSLVYRSCHIRLAEVISLGTVNDQF